MNTEPVVEGEVIEPKADKLAVVPKTNALVRPGVGVLFASVAEVWSVAEGLRKGGAGPAKSTTASIAAAILKGQALGLDPITAMGQITVVNGRASLMGDLGLALVRKSGLLGSLKREWIGTEGEDDYGCRITASRKDTGEEITYAFTFGEAKKAGILRTAIWTGFTKRMVYYRALGFVLRDLFSDVVMGMYLTEELKTDADFEREAKTPDPVLTPQQAAEVQADPFFEPPAESPVEENVGTPTEVPTVVEAVPVEPAVPPAVERMPDTRGPDVEAVLGVTTDDVLSGVADAVLAAAASAPEPEPNSPEDPFRGFRDPEPASAPVVIPPSARKLDAPVEVPAATRRRRARAVAPSSTVTVVKNEPQKRIF